MIISVLLGVPWLIAAIYAGWERSYTLSSILIVIGVVLFFLGRPAIVLQRLQRNPISTIAWMIFTQFVIVAISFLAGSGAKTLLQ